MAFGLAETAKLAVDLSLKGNFASSLAASQRSLTGFNKAITNTQGRAYKAGQQIGAGIRSGAVLAAGGIAFLVTQVAAGVRQLAVLEQATAQTNAVLKSTRSIAGQTADSIRKLAEKYEGLNATIDDKVIQSGENLLLTFTNIRKQAFEPALEAALNLNTRLGGGEGGLQNTIKLLGKALNDPLKGLGALSRAGITFSKQQTDQIKTLVKNNDLLGAQDLILKELGKRYGGAFKAEGNTATGVFRGIGDAVEDLQKAIATGLFPVIQKVLPKIRSALADPKVIATIQRLGDSIASLFSDKNIAEGGKILGSLFETAKAAAPVVGEAARATLTAVKAAVSLFTSLPKEVQQLAIGAFAINKITGGLVTNLAGGLISSVLKQLVSGVVNVNGAVVNVNGGVGLPGVTPTGGGGGIIGTLKGAAKALIPLAIGIGIAEGFAQGNKDDEARRAAGQATFYGTGNLDARHRATAGMSVTIAGVSSAAAKAITAGGFDSRIADAQINKNLVAAVTAESKTTTAVEGMKGAMGIDADRQITAAEKIRSGLNLTKTAVTGVGRRVEAARRAQVAAAQRTTDAIRHQKRTIVVQNAITVKTSISSRLLTTTTARQNRYQNIPS